MKNLALLLATVLGTSVLATAAPIQTKPATPVKEVSMAKPATHKKHKAKKEVTKPAEAKVEASKPEMKK